MSTMMLDKAQTRMAFRRAADTYDDSAVLQREVAKRMLDRLELIKRRPERVIDVGCGTGFCGQVLEKRYKGVTIVGIDVAESMLTAAKTKTRWRSRQRFVCGDAEYVPLTAGSADMVVSNLTLQWCDPDKVFKEFARVLRPGGLLMFSSFGPDTLKELRAAWRSVDDQPHVHAFIDMHDLGDALVRAGFADPVMDVEHFTLTYPDVMTVLHDLKNLGAHNVDEGRARGLTGKTRFARFRSAYESQACDGLIPASFEAVYGHAWLPEAGATRKATDGSVAIPVNRIGRRR